MGFGIGKFFFRKVKIYVTHFHANSLAAEDMSIHTKGDEDYK